ncbi:hypothetical protein [uncultured Planktosalinus sp.]|uniref:hypothetical protein n=1 Tax=uncultured Planktosalinus sp. TaxID=1810935 RepID=UPI0030D72B24
MKKLLPFILLCFTYSVAAQVGINTQTPQAELDVQGNVKIDTKLYLESPGNSTQIRGSKLLIQKVDGEIIEYDIQQSKYGPINYAQFIFRETATHGLQDYDTKISTEDYIVTVQGYYFTAENNNTNVLLKSNVNEDYIEGYQFYAYPNIATNTWFLRAFVNNSTFRSGTGYNENPVDIFLNIVIYRKGFIAKSLNAISVNMNNSETGTAPLPGGFPDID